MTLILQPMNQFPSREVTLCRRLPFVHYLGISVTELSKRHDTVNQEGPGGARGEVNSVEATMVISSILDAIERAL